MATQQITNRQVTDDTLTNAKINSAAAIASTKLAAFSANRDAGGFKLTNLANATASTDAVTKGQLDSAVVAAQSGFQFKDAARVASTANVGGTYTATGGTGGTGSFAAMPNSIDGQTLVADDRVLLKNQTTGAQNGLYKVLTPGTGSDGTWERASDADATGELKDGTFVPIAQGTANADTLWVQTATIASLGGATGTALVFTKFEAGVTYAADGTTLSLTGSTFSITPLGVGTASLAATSVTLAKMAADSVDASKIVDGSVGAAELASNAVTTIKILDANVTTAKIADNNVTTAKILDANVTLAKLAANSVDASKIVDLSVGSAELAANSVITTKILDANVTTAKLANNAVTGAKISFIAQTVTGTPNNVLTTFTTSAAADAASLIVWIRGVRQRPVTDFTYSGSTITFTTAPDTLDDIAVFGIVA